MQQLRGLLISGGEDFHGNCGVLLFGGYSGGFIVFHNRNKVIDTCGTLGHFRLLLGFLIDYRNIMIYSFVQSQYMVGIFMELILM